MATFAFGWTDTLGTSGKSNMSESESESGCSLLNVSRAVSDYSSCFSSGGGPVDLTNCVGPFSKSSCFLKNSVSEAAGSHSISCSTAISFRRFSFFSGDGARTDSSSINWRLTPQSGLSSVAEDKNSFPYLAANAC